MSRRSQGWAPVSAWPSEGRPVNGSAAQCRRPVLKNQLRPSFHKAGSLARPRLTTSSMKARALAVVTLTALRVQ
jgi:hypothetical protein